MANPGIIAPSTGNLMVGKGFIIFQVEGTSSWFHLGNCPSLTVSPKVTNLDHFDSMQGVKTMDLRIATEKSMELKIQMEEFTANNMALLFLGDVDETDPLHPSVNLFTAPQKTGHLKYYATNEQGPRWYVDLPSVSIQPSGEWAPISDAFASMEAAGIVNSVAGVWGTATLADPVGTVEPENVLQPFIYGTAQVGVELEVMIGGWIGADEISYQWEAVGVPIPYATERTYTPVVGDIGDTLTCVVTGTNSIGDTTSETEATAAVIAA